MKIEQKCIDIIRVNRSSSNKEANDIMKIVKSFEDN